MTPPAATPAITSITPASGSQDGGDAIVIDGVGFTGATEVDFGATAATDLVVASDTTMTCTSPAGSGAATVTVVTPNGNATGSYNYVTPLPPDIQAQVDQIEADIAAKAAAAAEAEAALQAAIDTMTTAKEVCLTSCGPLSDVIAHTTDPAELSALLTLAEQTHAPHAAQLEAAYQTFVGATSTQSNPAPVGVTNIESGMSAEGGATAS